MRSFGLMVIFFFIFGCVEQPKPPTKPNLEDKINKASPQIQRWVADLRSGDSERQVQAVAFLGKQEDPRVLDILLAIAGHPEEDGLVRMDAIHAIGALGKREAVAPLLALLEREMEERRGLWAALIPALGALGDASAVPLLIKLANNDEDDWLGRSVAVQALGEIGTVETLPTLMAAARTVDTRADAIRALAAMGDDRAVSLLIEAIQEDEESEIIQSARQGLIRLGTAALPAIQDALQEPTSKEYLNTWQRKALLRVTAEIGGEEAAQLLSTLSNDVDPEIASEAKTLWAAIK